MTTDITSPPKDRYFLKASWQPDYVEVSREEYIRAERIAGFESKHGPNLPATASFSAGSVSGRTWP